MPKHARRRHGGRPALLRRHLATVVVALVLIGAGLGVADLAGTFRATHAGQASILQRRRPPATSSGQKRARMARSSPPMIELGFGRQARVEDPASTGIISVTVFSLAATPSPTPGQALWVADIATCAGASGSLEGPQLAYFALILANGTAVAPSPLASAVNPSLTTVTTLDPNSCGRGLLLFATPTPARPVAVRYEPDPAHRYLWERHTRTPSLRAPGSRRSKDAPEPG